MDETTLSQLLRRLAAGDREAVTPLFIEARGPLLGFFYRLCRSTDQAEDLLQNTFLSLWRYRVGYRGIDSARGYLYRVALHEWHRSSQRARRIASMTEPMLEEPRETLTKSPTEGMESDETTVRVRSAIGALPDAQREAILMHRFEGLSCREIAAITGESIKTIESRIRLALLKLAEKLKVRGGTV